MLQVRLVQSAGVRFSAFVAGALASATDHLPSREGVLEIPLSAAWHRTHANLGGHPRLGFSSLEFNTLSTVIASDRVATCCDLNVAAPLMWTAAIVGHYVFNLQLLRRYFSLFRCCFESNGALSHQFKARFEHLANGPKQPTCLKTQFPVFKFMGRHNIL